jgi:hypothetical protein
MYGQRLMRRRLGTLQTCIADTNHSLDELMANIYNDALADGVSTLVIRQPLEKWTCIHFRTVPPCIRARVHRAVEALGYRRCFASIS